jgi:broad specificity phosphatase PhoE
MYLLRHGQSLFNLHYTETHKDPGIEDPVLTPLGQAQAEAAAELLADKPITRIIVSPYTRALQTAQPVLTRLRLPAEVMHEVRERFAFACDIGSHRDLLAERFPHHQFDHLPDRWWPEARETSEEAIARADWFRAEMAAREDSETTLLVSHWAFILALTGISVENGEVLQYDPHSPAPNPVVWRR